MQVLKRCNITSYPIARRLPVASFRPHPVDVDVELPGGELEQPAVLGVAVLADGRVRAHPQLPHAPRGEVLHNRLQGSVHRLGLMVARVGERAKPELLLLAPGVSGVQRDLSVREKG